MPTPERPKFKYIEFPVVMWELGEYVAVAFRNEAKQSWSEIGLLEKDLGGGLCTVKMNSDNCSVTAYKIGAKPLVTIKKEPTDEPTQATKDPDTERSHI